MKNFRKKCLLALVSLSMAGLFFSSGETLTSAINLEQLRKNINERSRTRSKSAPKTLRTKKTEEDDEDDTTNKKTTTKVKSSKDKNKTDEEDEEKGDDEKGDDEKDEKDDDEKDDEEKDETETTTKNKKKKETEKKAPVVASTPQTVVNVTQQPAAGKASPLLGTGAVGANTTSAPADLGASSSMASVESVGLGGDVAETQQRAADALKARLIALKNYIDTSNVVNLDASGRNVILVQKQSDLDAVTTQNSYFNSLHADDQKGIANIVNAPTTIANPAEAVSAKHKSVVAFLVNRRSVLEGQYVEAFLNADNQNSALVGLKGLDLKSKSTLNELRGFNYDFNSLVTSKMKDEDKFAAGERYIKWVQDNKMYWMPDLWEDVLVLYRFAKSSATTPDKAKLKRSSLANILSKKMKEDDISKLLDNPDSYRAFVTTLEAAVTAGLTVNRGVTEKQENGKPGLKLSKDKLRVVDTVARILQKSSLSRRTVPLADIGYLLRNDYDNMVKKVSSALRDIADRPVSDSKTFDLRQAARTLAYMIDSWNSGDSAHRVVTDQEMAMLPTYIDTISSSLTGTALDVYAQALLSQEGVKKVDPNFSSRYEYEQLLSLYNDVMKKNDEFRALWTSAKGSFSETSTPSFLLGKILVDSGLVNEFKKADGTNLLGLDYTDGTNIPKAPQILDYVANIDQFNALKSFLLSNNVTTDQRLNALRKTKAMLLTLASFYSSKRFQFIKFLLTPVQKLTVADIDAQTALGVTTKTYFKNLLSAKSNRTLLELMGYHAAFLMQIARLQYFVISAVAAGTHLGEQMTQADNGGKVFADSTAKNITVGDAVKAVASHFIRFLTVPLVTTGLEVDFSKMTEITASPSKESHKFISQFFNLANLSGTEFGHVLSDGINSPDPISLLFSLYVKSGAFVTWTKNVNAAVGQGNTAAVGDPKGDLPFYSLRAMNQANPQNLSYFATANVYETAKSILPLYERILGKNINAKNGLLPKDIDDKQQPASSGGEYSITVMSRVFGCSKTYAGKTDFEMFHDAVNDVVEGLKVKPEEQKEFLGNYGLESTGYVTRDKATGTGTYNVNYTNFGAYTNVGGLKAFSNSDFETLPASVSTTPSGPDSWKKKTLENMTDEEKDKALKELFDRRYPTRSFSSSTPMSKSIFGSKPTFSSPLGGGEKSFDWLMSR